jgi:putative endonuclease
MRFPPIPGRASVAGRVWVYILQTADGSFYIGQTGNVQERLRKHRLGLGSKHTSDHDQPLLVHCEGPFSPSDAAARERQLKRWSRAKKEALIRGDAAALHVLSQSRD